MQALRLVDTKSMSHEDFVRERRRGIGGSDVSAICGLNPWKSALTVFLEKKGEVPEEEDNDRMMFGRLLEPVIAAVFAERTGLKVQKRNAILCHPKNTWALANIDRLIIDQENGDGVLEIKTTSEYNKESWEDEHIPDMHLVQLQWYLYITGLAYGWFCTLAGGQKLYHTRIERDDSILEHLVRICGEFWDNLQKGIPPAADGSAASTKVINLLYPEAVPAKRIHLPFEAHEWLAAYEQHKAGEKAAKELKDEAANKVKAVLGDAEIGLLDNHEAVTWKTVNRKGYVVQPTSYRDFRAK